MKKFLALLLTLTMVLSLVAVSAVAEAVNPDDIEDNMTSADNKYEIAFVTDVGQLKDKSFNQGTWNGVKGCCRSRPVLQVLSARQRRSGH